MIGDKIDRGHQRADLVVGNAFCQDEFDVEAFLLEVLSDFQVTVPEIGTFGAKQKPLVFLTSNDAREMSDALKRRCLHLWIDFPDEDLEVRILDAPAADAVDPRSEQLISLAVPASAVGTIMNAAAANELWMAGR